MACAVWLWCVPRSLNVLGRLGAGGNYTKSTEVNDSKEMKHKQSAQGRDVAAEQKYEALGSLLLRMSCYETKLLLVWKIPRET